MIEIYMEDDSNVKNVSPGSVVKLSKDTFSKSPGATLTANHLFVVALTVNNRAMVCPISSNMNQVSDDHPSNVLISDWETAGLRKPSYAGTDTLGVTSVDNIDYEVGSLSKDDYKSILISMRNYVKNPRNTLESNAFQLRV